MKSLQIIKSLLIFTVVLIAIVSCEEDKDSKSPLAGEWSKVVMDRTCTLIISNDNKFETDFINDAGNDVWGSIKISGNQVTITDEGGLYKSDLPGVYTFQVVGNSVTFVEVNDPEDGRKVLLEGIWTK